MKSKFLFRLFLIGLFSYCLSICGQDINNPYAPDTFIEQKKGIKSIKHYKSNTNEKPLLLQSVDSFDIQGNMIKSIGFDAKLNTYVVKNSYTENKIRKSVTYSYMSFYRGGTRDPLDTHLVLIYVRNYTYNTNGLLIKETEHNNTEPAWEAITAYKYNSHGKMTEKKTKGPDIDGEFGSIVKYYYDKNDNIIRKEFYNNTGDFLNSKHFKQYDSDNKCIKDSIIVCNGLSECISEGTRPDYECSEFQYSYHKKNTIKSILITTPNPEIKFLVSFEYEKKERISKILTMKNEEEFELYECEYY